MRIIYWLLICFLGGNSAFGQDKTQTTLIEGGILTYGVATKELGFSFRGIHSRKLAPEFYVGLGSGYEKYMLNEVDGKSFKTLPIFAQAKYVFKPEKAKTLFAAFDLGYSMGSLNKGEDSDLEKTSYKGGLLASPQVGIQLYTKNRRKFLRFTVGYKYQGFTENRYYNSMWIDRNFFASEALQGFDNYTESKYNMHRLSFMIGFGF